MILNNERKQLLVRKLLWVSRNQVTAYWQIFNQWCN